MIKSIRYWLWKIHAEKAIKEKRTAVCCRCSDPIIPGDFIGIAVHKEKKEMAFIHAGFHFSVSEINAFCDTKSIGSAYWNGKKAIALGRSLTSKVFLTGKTQVV